MLNKYLKNLNDLVSKYIDQPLHQFRGPNKKPASFDDPVWYFIWPDGRSTRILCTTFNGSKVRGDNNFKDNLYLNKPYSYLLKIYIIETCARNLSAGNIQQQAIEARKILSKITTTLDDIPADAWNHLYSNYFCNFCKKHKLVYLNQDPTTIKDNRDRYGDIAINNKQQKIPSERSILALASIFNDTFKNIKEDGSITSGSSIDISDALVTTYVLLSVSSPNRMSSEIPVLEKQKLQKFSEANGKLVYYLEWQGSKGFKNNKNHILSSLASQVDKAINFFIRHTAPSRIISRFYEDKNLSLRTLIQGYNVEKKRLKKLFLDDVPHLFTLGYALGIYNHDKTVHIITTPISELPSNPISWLRFHTKEIPIYKLTREHIVHIKYEKSYHNSFYTLIGTTIQHGNRKDGLKILMSIDELESWWINHVKSKLIPSFPVGYTNSENSICLKDALFLLRGGEINHKRIVSQLYELSPYALKTPKQLAHHIKARLNAQKSGNNKGISIFEKHGFGAEISVNPHQFRHFTNDSASRSSIPIEIITAWSGRKDSDQTYTYIHQRDGELSDPISAIVNTPETSKEGIIPIAMKDITRLANLPASITSSGICTQELNTTPCDYLNDFISQCFMCSSSCHVAGDNKATSFLKKDLSFQEKRLITVTKDPRIKSSDAMKSWYKIHKHQTMILSQLIDIMSSHPKGSIIHYANSTKDFKLTNLKSNEVQSIKLNLTENASNSNEVKVISNKENNDNPDLKALLSNYDLPLEDL